MTSHKHLEKADPNRIKYNWLNAMNTAADLIQTAAVSESKIFQVFRQQVSKLGLRGGIALLGSEPGKLYFKSIVEPGRTSLLGRLESLLNLSAGEFSVHVDQVDVFHQVVVGGESVYVRETGEIIAQMLSFSEQSLVSKVIDAFGRDPAIYVPLTIQEEVVGLLNVAGPELTIDDLQPMKAFASYISAALANARLFQAVKDQEHKYRSLFDNLPVGIFRVSPEGKFIMANPLFLKQFHISDFSQIDGKFFTSTGLTPAHDREEMVYELLKEGELIGIETEWQSGSGERFYFKENIKAAHDSDGELLYFEGSVEDITQRKDTEKILHSQLDDLMILNRVAAIGAAANSLDELFERVTEIIGEQIYPDHFGVVQWDPDKGALRMHYSYRGVPEDMMDVRFQPGEGVIGRVFTSGEPILIRDTNQFLGYIPPGKKMGSELCVPIKAGDRVVGVLNAESKAVNGFTEEDKFLLMTIADQLATAFDRATFVDAVEQQALQLSLLNEAVLNTSRELDHNELINLISAQIRDLFKPDSFIVTLYDQDQEDLQVAIAVRQGEIDTETTGRTLSIDQAGLITLVIEAGEVLHVDDLERSPLIVGIEQFQTNMVGSWVGVPLVSGTDVIGALAVQYYDKKLIDEEQTQFLESMASHAAIAITNGRIFENIQKRFDLSNKLTAVSESLNRSRSLADVIRVVGESSTVLMDSVAGMVYRLMDDGSLACVWQRDMDDVFSCAIAEDLATGLIEHPIPLIIQDTSQLPGDSTLIGLTKEHKIGAISLWPLIYEGQTIAVVGCLKSQPYRWDDDEQDVMMTFARQAAVSIQNALLLESERIRRQEAEALYKTTTALTSTLNIDRVLDNILVELYRVVDYASASIQLLEDDIVRIVAVQGLLLAPNQVVGWEFPASNELIVEMRKTHKPIIVDDAIEDDRFSLPEAVKYVRGWIGVPLTVGEKMIGCLTIESDEVGAFNESHAEKAIAFANQAAIAIETARLFGQTQRRLEILQSIHAIDQAISRSRDLSVTFDVIMEQAINLLDVDVIRLFTYEQDAQFYELVAERNLISPNLLTKDAFYDPEMVRKSVDARRLLFNNQLHAAQGLTHRVFASYCVAPLSTHGRIRGVVEVFHAKKFTPNKEWLDLLNTLATQAAIAIENTDLLTSLKRSNEELISAYDRTLEGWAYALELRDRETVGHSRRVTEMTMRLARKIGISGTELANIRRGTLLHDIGKMGLPDSVLLKKGPLSPEQEEVMKTHPQLAYDMLVSIPYLRNALDIPYYHHEKWDGTGYPHGLKAEGIPLAARIFAVVDVWDAVIYDRPYREAWTRNDAIEYIKEQTGKHFDPQVVEVFLEIIEDYQ